MVSLATGQNGGVRHTGGIIYAGFGAMLLAVVASGCADPVESDAIVPRGDEPGIADYQQGLARLTDQQYRNAIWDVFGTEIAIPTNLDPVDEAGGFESVGASLSSVSAVGVERFESAAFQISQQILASTPIRSDVFECEPLDSDDPGACRERIFSRIGRLLWRRPLQAGELSRINMVADEAISTLNDEDAGLEFGLSILMMAPQFLYRDESGVDGQLDAHQLASKLSFFLWNSIPDTALDTAADDGSLLNAEVLKQQVIRMTEDPKAKAGVDAFFLDLLDLDLLDDMSKDPLVYKHMSSDLPAAAREETLAVISDIVLEKNDDYRTVFTTQETWVDRRLAAIYDIAAPNMEGFGWAYLDKSGGRRGLLGHASILALNAHAVSSSVTLRGIFVREKILCHDIPGPPANVSTSIPEASEDLPTMRERVAQHLEDPACASCHEMTDLIGLGLENFDGIARWRSSENGHQIDPTGSLDGVDFSNAWKLGAVLGAHPDIGPCLTQNLYAHAQHRVPIFEERDILEWHSKGFEEAGFRVLELMRDIALSDGFRLGEQEEGGDSVR